MRRLIPITIALVLAAAGCSGTGASDSTPASSEAKPTPSDTNPAPSTTQPAPSTSGGTASPSTVPSDDTSGQAGTWAATGEQLRSTLQKWEGEGVTGVGVMTVTASPGRAAATATVVQEGKLEFKKDFPSGADGELEPFPEAAIMPLDAIDVDGMITALEGLECPVEGKIVRLRGYEEHRNIQVQCLTDPTIETSWQDGEQVPNIDEMLPSERLRLLEKLHGDMTGQDVFETFKHSKSGESTEVMFNNNKFPTHESVEGTPVAAHYTLKSNGASLVAWTTLFDGTGTKALPVSSLSPEGLDKAITTDMGAPVSAGTECSFVTSGATPGRYMSMRTRTFYTNDGDPA